MISTIILGVERLNGGRVWKEGKERRRAWAVMSMLRK